MAFKPLSENRIADALKYRAEPYTLAVAACGGPSDRTDRVSQALRKELPGIMHRLIQEEKKRGGS